MDIIAVPAGETLTFKIVLKVIKVMTGDTISGV
jgi:hypothetical protein